MAARKRRHSSRRRVARRPAAHNPRRRRTTTRRHRRNGIFARRRTANPIRSHRRRRVHRRRRNPILGHGAGSQILQFAGAGLGLGIFTPIVSRTVGGMLPFGQFNQPVLTAGSGWLLSKIFGMFNFTRPLANPTLILGFSTAVIQVVQPYVRGFLGGGAAPANPTMSGWRGRGMRGIAAVHGVPPQIVALPPPPPSRANGMSGVGARPGVYAR